MKAVLWSRKAVLAAVIVEPIILDTDAGDDPIDPKFSIFPLKGTRQFCACAPDVANTDTANAMPKAADLQRPRQRKFLTNPVVV